MTAVLELIIELAAFSALAADLPGRIDSGNSLNLPALRRRVDTAGPPLGRILPRAKELTIAMEAEAHLVRDIATSKG